ncbi:hypothetical protein [Haloferax sp. ATB1]|uniref:hypothetical protein n=1 Tax=Haloferax sp. ATB1 TaxID=1508454 RepID=UPI0005B22245|nr:hypothetical protein [Haloferax sp. ATB1]
MDEVNTKAAVFRDFLELLDWQIPQNTQLEYSVEAFGQTYKLVGEHVLDYKEKANWIEKNSTDLIFTESDL